MPISTLFSQGLDSYLAENADSPNDFWLFQHIPKTAGSALRNQLFKALGSASGIDVKNIDPSLPLEKRRAEATRQFLQRSKKHPYRCAGGHITMPEVLRILHHHPDAKLITFLRDPVERVISDYVYFHQQEATRKSETAQRIFASFESFVNHIASQNKMFRFLAPDLSISDEDLSGFVERRFVFIGLQDSYAPSVELLGRLVGKKIDADARIRDSAASGSSKPEVSAADRHAIAAHNARDVYLFEHFRDRLQPFLKPE